MPRERWADIPVEVGYRASSLGRVRSLDRVLPDDRFSGGVMLTPWADKDGYLHVTCNGRDYHVARLVLLAFRGLPRRNTDEVLHKNGKRDDNRLANLRWGSKSTNAKDRERHRRQRMGRSTPREPETAAT